MNTCNAGLERRAVLGAMALAACDVSAAYARPAGARGGIGRYVVTLLSHSPPRFSVHAELPLDGDRLGMDDTYPAELPQMAAKAWPALISGLVVTDAEAKRIETTDLGRKGWSLSGARAGTVRLDYTVDFSIFAAAGWSSPLESVVADDKHLMVAGRSLFITTKAMTGSEVEFRTPAPWSPVIPWPRAVAGRRYAPRALEDLTDNLLVFSTTPPTVVKAANFTMRITAMGHWAPLTPVIGRVLGTVIKREVALMQYLQPEDYNVILIPTVDQGGEAYRQSFAYCFADPTAENEAVWGNTLAHEIFHYWNYARLKGADYASTQWFQEGFTEYVANLTLVSGGISTPDQFLAKLSEHVANARRLTTTLEAIGTHKGPPLYSAGALTAFCFDVMIRHASHGRRSIADLFRNLWKVTDGGARKYSWAEIRAALDFSANADWEGFYQAHIRGHDPLPLDRVLPLAGLTMPGGPDGPGKIVVDPKASPAARELWQAMTSGAVI